MSKESLSPAVLKFALGIQSLIDENGWRQERTLEHLFTMMNQEAGFQTNSGALDNIEGKKS